jgi:hypothetical protein
MENPHFLFGTATECPSPERVSGEFVFRLAEVQLATLSESHNSGDAYFDNFLKAAKFDHTGVQAAWIRGRIERLFETQQDQSLLPLGEWFCDGSGVSCRDCFKFSFVGATKWNEMSMVIPFICYGSYVEVRIRTGDFPVRNCSRYLKLLTSMATAFGSLLTSDITDVCDYTDTSIELGQEYQFGIVGGRPFSDWGKGEV